MLTDKENNRIQLSDSPNRHVLVLGSSGQGKTFFCCQRMEEELERGRNVLVYDFSSSYREKELEKAQFKYKEKVEILNPYGEKYYFPVKVGSTDRFCKSILNVLSNDLKVQSYLQKTALLQAIKIHMKSHTAFSFAEFFCTVERLYAQKLEEEGVRDERDSFLKILTRLEPYSDIENVNFEYSDVVNIKTGIKIVQLSDFPEHQRQFLTEFFIGMLWEEIMTDGNVGYDTVVLDEFQHLSMSKYGALPKLLRQSRKNGLSLILLSQFIRNYTPEEQDLLLLAGNILLLKPTVKDRVSCADIVDRNNIKFWAAILDNLQVGEAVLIGNYSVKNCSEIWQKPVICKVKKAEKKLGRSLNPNYRKLARRRCAPRFEQH